MATKKRASSKRRESDESSSADEFGRRLRAARRMRDLTLRDVHEKSGVSITYLSDLERGVLSNPTVETLRQVALALDVSIDELLGGTQTLQSDLSAALSDFSSSTAFRGAVEEDSQRWKADPAVVEKEWIECLARVSVGGRRPKTASDYHFIMEAIRRAVGAR